MWILDGCRVLRTCGGVWGGGSLRDVEALWGHCTCGDIVGNRQYGNVVV